MNTRLFALGLALLAACGSTPTAPGPAPSGTAGPEPVAAQAGAQHAHDAGDHAATPSPAHRPNRDPHGDPDVARYAARLADPARIAELRVDEVVTRLSLAEDALVGDLGCGPGVFALPLARAVRDGLVFASDVEPGQLDALRSALREADVRNVVPVLSSFEDPHFPPGRLDLVFVGDTYHHLRDRVAYFRRLRSVLAPGGRLAILEYKPGKLPVGPPEDHKLAAGVREAELMEAGWVLVERFATHTWHDFEVWRVVQPWEK
ncbi:MAG: class I SAM-dependent methyltransferase [Planctomycetes bacterium]|nr:class I SAM-dependent methyltransferase [Planctomycetota bacterium]